MCSYSSSSWVAFIICYHFLKQLFIYIQGSLKYFRHLVILIFALQQPSLKNKNMYCLKSLYYKNDDGILFLLALVFELKFKLQFQFLVLTFLNLKNSMGWEQFPLGKRNLYIRETFWLLKKFGFIMFHELNTF